jgi:hypothetical protein
VRRLRDEVERKTVESRRAQKVGAWCSTVASGGVVVWGTAVVVVTLYANQTHAKEVLKHAS